MTAVPFVDIEQMARWVRDEGAEPVIAGIAATIEADFLRWPQFDKTPRIAAHSPEGVIELMPTSDGRTYGFKYVNGHPSNPARGLQTVTAFGVLADVASGYPIFLAEMTILTALRTAATSALAAQWLARPDARTLTLIGTGSQAEFQALGFRALLGIDTLRIWDTDPAAMAKFVRNVAPLGFNVHVSANADEAVLGADIITTCTADKAQAAILTDAMIGPGVHLNAIGGDCPGKTELDPAILRRARVFVEYTEQTRVEGEIQQVEPDFEVTELWEVLSGRRRGRTDSEDITVWDSVGFAIEDFSALRYVQQAVAGTAYQTQLNLIADPTDPKDLFGAVVTTDAVVAV
jgi:ornithine cyclodeaminase